MNVFLQEKLMMACAAECVFEEGGFISADKTIDKDQVLHRGA